MVSWHRAQSTLRTMQNHHYIDWSGNGAHPEVLVEEDLPAILESGKWFTRKVDPEISAELIKALDAIQAG